MTLGRKVQARQAGTADSGTTGEIRPVPRRNLSEGFLEMAIEVARIGMAERRGGNAETTGRMGVA
jgi:hypothetical protein